MIVGFTGTQEGMSRLQKSFLEGVLARLCPEEFHHGDCVGADAEAHEIVRLNVPRCRIIIHPPDVDSKRAFCSGDEARAPRPYLARDLAIVACCDELIAAPKSIIEELRSGTWATIRYARKAQKRIHLLRPMDKDLG